MPQGAWNKAPAAVKRRYFELIRTGMSGSAAAQRLGVSLSCGSVWFLDAGQLAFIEKPISSRYFSALAGYGAITMKNALALTMSTLPTQLARSLTWDRGKELSAHAQFRVETGIPVLFADPNSP